MKQQAILLSLVVLCAIAGSCAGRERGAIDSGTGGGDLGPIDLGPETGPLTIEILAPTNGQSFIPTAEPDYPGHYGAYFDVRARVSGVGASTVSVLDAQSSGSFGFQMGTVAVTPEGRIATFHHFRMGGVILAGDPPSSVGIQVTVDGAAGPAAEVIVTVETPP